MLEIFKLIYEYSRYGKIVDKDFFIKLISMETNMKNLGMYIQQDPKFETISQSDDEYYVASYNSSKKVITIFLNGVERMLENTRMYLDLFSNFEKLFFPNYLVSMSIEHEIAHAHNIKRKLFGTNIVSDLLRLADEASRAQYYAFYELDFDERYADIRANMEVISLLSYITPSAPNLLDFFNTALIERLISNYEQDNDTVISPTLEYFHFIGVDRFLPNFDWYTEEDFASLSLRYRENFPLTERLLYGFPISNAEYDRYMNTLKLSRKWMIENKMSS